MHLKRMRQRKASAAAARSHNKKSERNRHPPVQPVGSLPGDESGQGKPAMVVKDLTSNGDYHSSIEGEAALPEHAARISDRNRRSVTMSRIRPVMPVTNPPPRRREGSRCRPGRRNVTSSSGVSIAAVPRR